MKSDLEKVDIEIFNNIKEEKIREHESMELIASENFTSPAVIQAFGSELTNKYAEGYPGRRYYGGCEVVDKVERLAIERGKALFGASWVNVQPHSGASANFAVYHAFMNPGDTLLGFHLSHGGHLTHGSPVNFSGQLYNAQFYGVEESSGVIDMDRVREKAKKVKPKMISIGASAYSRDFDYQAFRDIANEVGAFLWMDMAHTAGLIAGKVLNDPLPFADVITTTTHKTLRGPRGGMILVGNDCENRLGVKDNKSGRVKNISEVLDSAVFPGTQGGPLMHIIAGKAVAFGLGLLPSFTNYQIQVQKNAQVLAEEMLKNGYNLVSGGTDNHLILVDLRNKGLNGKIAERALNEAGIIVNKNMVPYDTESPFITSGIRIGTPAMTTRGFKQEEFTEVGRLIHYCLENHDSPTSLQAIKKKVKEITSEYPLYVY